MRPWGCSQPGTFDRAGDGEGGRVDDGDLVAGSDRDQDLPGGVVGNVPGVAANVDGVATI